MYSTLQSMERTGSIFDIGRRPFGIVGPHLESKMDVSSDPPQPLESRIWKENTYRVGPKNTFQPFRARSIAEKVVNKWIKRGAIYSQDWAKTTTKSITTDVEKLVKQLECDRYKFVVQAFVGQKNKQGLLCSSRCLSDPETDSFAEYKFENESVWCLVLIFALYYE